MKGRFCLDFEVEFHRLVAGAKPQAIAIGTKDVEWRESSGSLSEEGSAGTIGCYGSGQSSKLKEGLMNCRY
jgi:hypothetical protein